MNEAGQDLNEIGETLVDHAVQHAEFSARGIIGELFPYIYHASRRMSTRAISRWLAEGPKVKLSAVSIAKALRNPEKYWEQFADFIEPKARIVEEALDWPMEEFLFNAEGFEHEINDPKTKPTVSGDSQREIENSIGEYRDAVAFLQRRWFSLDPGVRGNCWKYLRSNEEEK